MHGICKETYYDNVICASIDDFYHIFEMEVREFRDHLMTSEELKSFYLCVKGKFSKH